MIDCSPLVSAETIDFGSLLLQQRIGVFELVKEMVGRSFTPFVCI